MPRIITIELIAYDEKVGAGVDGDPVRLKESYCLPNGDFVMDYDPVEDKIYGAINMVNLLRDKSK